MAGLPQPAVTPARITSMRPPPKPSTIRSQSAMPPRDRSGVVSPAYSVASAATAQNGSKRKERDFNHDKEETDMNVVVRCRGRNDRETTEKSRVISERRNECRLGGDQDS